MEVKESLRLRLVRYRHLLKHFVLYRLLRRAWIKETRKIKGRYAGGTCFVMATGPSVNRLDLGRIEQQVKSGAKVIGINSYLSTDLADRIKPDYFIISDPCYLDLPAKYAEYQDEIDRDLNAIRRKSGFRFVIPHHWQSDQKFMAQFGEKRPLFFNHSENIAGRPNGADLVRPRYYVAMTSYIGVSLALYMGFKKIYLCGFDENRVEGMEIDKNNHVIWRENHFFPESEERCRRDMTIETGLTWESYCIATALGVRSQKKLNADAIAMGAEVLNTNPGSYVVGFAKTEELLAK